jgi:hypothetical protein
MAGLALVVAPGDRWEVMTFSRSVDTKLRSRWYDATVGAHPCVRPNLGRHMGLPLHQTGEPYMNASSREVALGRSMRSGKPVPNASVRAF